MAGVFAGGRAVICVEDDVIRGNGIGGNSLGGNGIEGNGIGTFRQGGAGHVGSRRVRGAASVGASAGWRICPDQ